MRSLFPILTTALLLADLVVVDRDLLQLAADGRASQIEQTRVLLTMFDGRPVFEADVSR